MDQPGKCSNCLNPEKQIFYNTLMFYFYILSDTTEKDTPARHNADHSKSKTQSSEMPTTLENIQHGIEQLNVSSSKQSLSLEKPKSVQLNSSLSDKNTSYISAINELASVSDPGESSSGTDSSSETDSDDSTSESARNSGTETRKRVQPVYTRQESQTSERLL